MSTPAFIAALFVPFFTGSTIVSPWTITIFAPRFLASFTRSGISSGEAWVISAPGKASIEIVGLIFSIALTIRGIIKSILDASI